ncbi:hypothetical protein SKAU_G00166510 [Synaphobranchus kaupii]|uniref:Uncharacterized protein n=1 Tax=Synaphobranchus kaupii TaxID=118154 RepID=A0A9Q1FJQ9_SYNKA|nr:hypothetical protein SKAU_G00166510 [Synaphobranchus kaupii]
MLKKAAGLSVLGVSGPTSTEASPPGTGGASASWGETDGAEGQGRSQVLAAPHTAAGSIANKAVVSCDILMTV